MLLDDIQNKYALRDRIVQQAVYTELYSIFEPKFIHHLYSSRIGKGTHLGVEELKRATLRVSKNNTTPCWALKCDVKRFYDYMISGLRLG